MNAVAEAFEFRLERISENCHIFLHPDLPELVNLQIDFWKKVF